MNGKGRLDEQEGGSRDRVGESIVFSALYLVCFTMVTIL